MEHINSERVRAILSVQDTKVQDLMESKALFMEGVVDDELKSMAHRFRNHIIVFFEATQGLDFVIHHKSVTGKAHHTDWFAGTKPKLVSEKIFSHYDDETVEMSPLLRDLKAIKEWCDSNMILANWELTMGMSYVSGSWTEEDDM
jgi:hypothetical protein